LYASDVLLIHELGRAEQRPSLIAKLRTLRSNSVAVPALIAIWAMMEGLSLNVRGCDWNVPEVCEWIGRIMRNTTIEMSTEVELKTESNTVFVLTGAIEGRLHVEAEEPTGRLAILRKTPDMLVRCRGSKAIARNHSSAQSFLEHCADVVRAA